MVLAFTKIEARSPKKTFMEVNSLNKMGTNIHVVLLRTDSNILLK